MMDLRITPVMEIIIGINLSRGYEKQQNPRKFHGSYMALHGI